MLTQIIVKYLPVCTNNNKKERNGIKVQNRNRVNIKTYRLILQSIFYILQSRAHRLYCGGRSAKVGWSFPTDLAEKALKVVS